MKKDRFSREKKITYNKADHYIGKITEDFQLQLAASSYTSFCLKFDPKKAGKNSKQ
jgi:hypothetical protein